MATTINSIGDLYGNPEITGHALVAPALFYGDQVRGLFAEFPADARIYELAKRTFIALVSLATLPLAAIAFTLSTLGLAIKFFSYVPGNLPQNPPAPGAISQDLPKLLEDTSLLEAGVIYREFDQLFDDLDNLHKGKGESLADKIKAFDQKNPNLDKNGKAAKIIAEVKRSFEQLNAMKAGLFVNAPKSDENGIVKVPSDGNCLFHSLLIGLKLMETQLKARKLWDPVKLADHSALRKAAVDWMKRHYTFDQLLKDHIFAAIEAFKFTQTEDLTMKIQAVMAEMDLFAEDSEDYLECQGKLENLQEQLDFVEALVAPESYFELVAHDGVFGSAAEIYAISEIFKCNIEVSRDVGGGRLVQGFDLINPKTYPLPSLHLIHYGDHFNAKINGA
jgi:hypothetical protein